MSTNLITWMWNNVLSHLNETKYFTDNSPTYIFISLFRAFEIINGKCSLRQSSLHKLAAYRIGSAKRSLALRDQRTKHKLTQQAASAIIVHGINYKLEHLAWAEWIRYSPFTLYPCVLGTVWERALCECVSDSLTISKLNVPTASWFGVNNGAHDCWTTQ